MWNTPKNDRNNNVTCICSGQLHNICNLLYRSVKYFMRSCVHKVITTYTELTKCISKEDKVENPKTMGKSNENTNTYACPQNTGKSNENTNTYACLQNMFKAPAKFQNNLLTTVGGVVHTRHPHRLHTL